MNEWPTNTPTNTQTHRQDRLQYTAPLSLARSVTTEFTPDITPRRRSMVTQGGDAVRAERIVDILRQVTQVAKARFAAGRDSDTIKRLIL